MFTTAACALMLLLLSGRAQGQEYYEYTDSKMTCPNAPFTYTCFTPIPFKNKKLVLNIRSITVFSDVSDPTPALAVNNSCPLSLSRCGRIIEDANDQGLKNLPEYDYFYKWLHNTCDGKHECNGTMPAPNRLKGINEVCSEVDISYFVAVSVNFACVRNLTIETFTPLPETTIAPTLEASRLVTYTGYGRRSHSGFYYYYDYFTVQWLTRWPAKLKDRTFETFTQLPETTNAPTLEASRLVPYTGDRVGTTVAALQTATQKPTNNLVNAFIDALWVRSEGRSIYFGREPLQQCILLLALLLVVL